MIIIFSKDRAFQLEACLRSLMTQCRDAKDVPIRVIWTAVGEQHERSYAILRESFAQATKMEFVRETNLRADTVSVLGGLKPKSWQDGFMRFVEGLSARWLRKLLRPLVAWIWKPAPAILYAVDDTIFLRPFSFADCERQLLARKDALAFSLRLGRGLTRFYMGNCDQKVPEMKPVDEAAGVYEFCWPKAEGDFAYPLEVSSSLLKSEVFLARLLRKEWRTPNTLEVAMANMSGRYKKDYPILLTFLDPRAVCVPLNLVQKDFTDNRHGADDRHHPDRLCALYLQGIRADLAGMKTDHLIAVHAELELLPNLP